MAWGLVLFIIFIFLVTIIPYQRQHFLSGLSERAKVAYTSTAQAAVESIILDDYSLVVEHCVNMVEKNPTLLYVVLTRKDGFSLIHTPTYWRQDTLAGIWQSQEVAKDNAAFFTKNQFAENQVYHITFPLEYSGINWGWIHLGLSPEKYYNDLRALYIRTFIITLIAGLGGLLVSILYARSLYIPIQRLENYALKIASGNVTEPVLIQTGDEIENLAKSFNNMVVQLEQSNLERVKSAHQAGMTEMIINVLHNVGNVLNSVGVLSNSLTEKAQKSKVTSLVQLNTLLEDESENIADFLVKDPRGKKVPDYLSALTTHLANENQGLITDLSALDNHIQHIKKIIHLQQSYSKSTGFTELLQITDIIEDGLQFNAESLKRHRISIIRDFQVTPSILVDRNKVLQILTNLISNAQNALEHEALGKKEITITLFRSNDTTIRLQIIDNGMGIVKENQTKIFQHGFTTRVKGHGFGLHSSAIAAAEMKGSLQVYSGGPGKGATFTLDLPYHSRS